MNLLDTLMASAQSGSLNQAAKSRGIDSGAMPALLKQLVPALTSGMQRNAQGSGGIESLKRALSSGNHQRYLDDAAALDQESTVADGNGILGHLLGSKDVSRNLASRAAKETGLDVGAIKQFLPVVAAAAMGAMSKQTNGGAAIGADAGSSGLAGMLGGFLDSDGDGSALDDLFSLGAKFLK